EVGEEITLLPYDYDIGNGGGSGEKTKESEIEAGGDTGNGEKSTENSDQAKSDAEHLLPDDQTVEGDDFTTFPTAEPEESGGEFGNKHGRQEELHEHDTPADQQPEPTEPEEPSQPEKSKTFPVLPHPEPNFPQPNVNQPSCPLPAPIHPCQPKSHPELPEPHNPQPAPISSGGSEVCQIIATGMNMEMQQYASSLASQAFAQFPNHLMAIARHIMMNFEERYGPPWSCIVSNGQLGFYLRYDRQNHIYFALSGHTIFLYKDFTS
ncbi:unnamed protein product, partial [Onchocerca ochengi]|uniref:Dynein light chain n=1 Tax=Onchocerca ochengi TaxID=42157 RepID=A0A182ER42_ONCOC